MLFKNQKNTKINSREQTLLLRINTLEKAIQDISTFNKNSEKEKEEILKRIKTFCFNILVSEIAKQQMSGNNFITEMNIHQLLNYTEQAFQKKLDEEKKLLTTLLNTIEEKDKLIEDLKGELSRYTVKEKVLIQNAFDDENKEAEQEKEIIKEEKPEPILNPVVQSFVLAEEDMVILPPIENDNNDEEIILETKKENIPIKKNRFENKRTIKKALKENQAVMVENIINEPGPDSSVEEKEIAKKIDTKVIKEMKEIMSDIMWMITTAVGEQGLSESKDIKKFVTDQGITESSFNNALTQMRKNKILDEEKINTGWRWFYAYELSLLGKKLFLEKFKKDIVICEKQQLKKEHSTCLHGYCIKDTAHILKAFNGYETVSTSREPNKVALYNGTSYIPDVIASKKDGTVVDYFEVELGHHTQRDFNDKCEKMCLVTRLLIFIVPEIETMKKLENQVNSWVQSKGGPEKLKGFSVCITTISKLIDGKYDIILPF